MFATDHGFFPLKESHRARNPRLKAGASFSRIMSRARCSLTLTTCSLTLNVSSLVDVQLLYVSKHEDLPLPREAIPAGPDSRSGESPCPELLRRDLPPVSKIRAHENVARLLVGFKLLILMVPPAACLSSASFKAMCSSHGLNFSVEQSCPKCVKTLIIVSWAASSKSRI